MRLRPALSSLLLTVSTLARGVMAGYPMIDVAVRLTGGSYHEIDSSEKAFQIAGSMGAQAAAREAAISRLYGGIHFLGAIVSGLEQGRCVGRAVNALRTRA